VRVRTFCAHPTGHRGVRGGMTLRRERLNRTAPVPCRTLSFPSVSSRNPDGSGDGLSLLDRRGDCASPCSPSALYDRGVTRIRTAVLALVIVFAAVIGVWFVHSTSGPASKAAPTLEQQFAAWKRSHPGYTCSPLDRSSKTSAGTLCITANDTQILVSIVSVSLPTVSSSRQSG